MRVKPLALVVDDDPIFRKMMEVVVTQLGFVVRAAETAEEFTMLSAILSPEIYIVDLQLGTENGLGLVAGLRSGGITAPIVVVSGNSDLGMVSHALEIGANEYIVKPFDKALLASKLHQFVKTHELDEHERYLKKLDGNGAEARVNFTGRLAGVDEMGMRFVTPHLVSKGTVLKLSGGVFSEIDPGTQECLLCVTATTLDSGSGQYEIYAEFEGADVNFLQSVRRWLSEKVVEKKAA